MSAPPIREEPMPKVLYEKGDRIARVTINRPEAKNAIDPETHDLLWQTWEDFRDDDAVDVAILTGSGDSFCAGADLKTYIPPLLDASPRWVRNNVLRGLGGLTRGLHRIPKPVIAAVNGWALAGGLETALACDIRIASERAMFGSFEARRGYHHGDGGIVRLVNTCGSGLALEMLLTAEPIDAQRALQANLVSRVVEHDRLLEEAEITAHQILRNSQTAVRSAKETILDVIGRPLDDQLRIEALNAYSTADPDETRALLANFSDKSDRGRAGTNATEL
jgi:enoyl-CoA hydratase/carnithine racemase